MSNVINLLNTDLVLENSVSKWMREGEAISLGRDHHISFHICPDGARVLVEKKARHRPHLFTIKNGHWLKFNVCGGFIQIMPKVIGSTKMLVDVALTPIRSAAIL